MYFLPKLRFIIPVYTPCAHIPSRALTLIIRIYRIGNGEEDRTSTVYYQLRTHSTFSPRSLYACKLIAFPRLTASGYCQLKYYGNCGLCDDRKMDKS